MKKRIGYAAIALASAWLCFTYSSTEHSVVCGEEIVAEVVTPAAVTSDSGIQDTKLKAAFDKKQLKLYPLRSAKNAIRVEGEYDKIVWKVSKKKYASITQDGTVTLKKNASGKEFTVSATISYTRGEQTYKKVLEYKVKGLMPVSSLEVTAKKNYVFVGKTLRLKASCYPETASKKKVKWRSQNPKYAMITDKGIVKPRKPGTGKTVKFTATAMDGSKCKGSLTHRIIDPNKPMIALTFDDGPSYMYTSRVLKQLKKYNARATFFVLGSKLGDAANKGLIEQSVKNGNEIASHTYNHRQLTAISATEVNWESEATQEAIRKITGSDPLLTRPPYGAYSDTVKASVDTPLVLWSIDTRDWQTRNADSVVASVLNNVQDGDIVLMHDIYDSTASAAERLIPELVGRGYQLVTVSELAEYKRIQLHAGQSYCALR